MQTKENDDYKCPFCKLGLPMLFAPILLDSFAGFSPASWYLPRPDKKSDSIKKAKRKAVKEAKRRNR